MLFTSSAPETRSICIIAESEPIRVSISSRDLMPFFVCFGHLIVIKGIQSIVLKRILEPLPYLYLFSQKSRISTRASVSGISTETIQKPSKPEFFPVGSV